MILSQICCIVVKNFWENSVHYKSGSSIAHWRVAWIFHLKNPIAREWFVRQSLFSPDWIAHSWGIWDPCHSHCFGLLSSDRDNLVKQPGVIQNRYYIEKEKKHSDEENPHFRHISFSHLRLLFTSATILRKTPIGCRPQIVLPNL